MRRLVVALAVAGVLAGCGRGGVTGGGPAGPEGSTSLAEASPGSATPAPTTTEGTTEPGGSPDHAGRRDRVEARRLNAGERAEMTGVSWHSGCPVPLTDLRHVEVPYWSFEGRRQRGEMVVNKAIVEDVRQIFERLFAQRFPIRRMEPIESYGGDDYRSIEADNTSAFNCRARTGSTEWSNHAYGVAIDLNPLENPYVYGGGRTSHDASVPYLDRGDVRPGMLVDGSRAVRVFEAAGWYWGGRWAEPTDYQHMSSRPG